MTYSCRKHKTQFTSGLGPKAFFSLCINDCISWLLALIQKLDDVMVRNPVILLTLRLCLVTSCSQDHPSKLCTSCPGSKQKERGKGQRLHKVPSLGIHGADGTLNFMSQFYKDLQFTWEDKAYPRNHGTMSGPGGAYQHLGGLHPEGSRSVSIYIYIYMNRHCFFVGTDKCIRGSWTTVLPWQGFRVAGNREHLMSLAADPLKCNWM